MQQSNLTVKDLFKNKTRLSFLIGAGCSTDPPSSLPLGREMMEALIRHACPESEINNILSIKDLRFEQLIEIIRDSIDPNLKIIDFYGLCDLPNKIHFFLAKMIEEGNYVLTTNFDNLIEIALLNLGNSKEDIIPVITKKNFELYSAPNEWYEKGKKLVYKVHGSVKNIITGEDTRDSLIATIQAFGSNKEGLNIFQIESFKRELFKHISKDRTLVIMGYSGSDDFDIVPTLRQLKDLKSIIWINHQQDSDGISEIYEIESSNQDIQDKINLILADIKKNTDIQNIYRINIDTLNLINILSNIKNSESKPNFSVNLHKWLKENLKSPDIKEKYNIAFKIYVGSGDYSQARFCSESMKNLAIEDKDEDWYFIALHNIALLYNMQGEYKKSIEINKQILENVESHNYLLEKGEVFVRIGEDYKELGAFSKALDYYHQALEIFNQDKDPRFLGKVYSNIGLIHKERGHYVKAIKYYSKSLFYFRERGDLISIATHINNLAIVKYKLGKYSEALQDCEDALKIFEELGNPSGIADCLNNISVLYIGLNKYNRAFTIAKDALKIYEDLGDNKGIVNSNIRIGNIFAFQTDFDRAIDYFEYALTLGKDIGYILGIAGALNRLGEIYLDKKDYNKAQGYFEDCLNIYMTLGDLSGKIKLLYQIGLLNRYQRNTSRALKYYKKALKIAKWIGHLYFEANIHMRIGEIFLLEKQVGKAKDSFKKGFAIQETLGNDSLKADYLNDVGVIYIDCGYYSDALKYCTESLEIHRNLGNLSTIAMALYNTGTVYSKLGKKQQALSMYNEALEILKTLELENSETFLLLTERIEVLKIN
ncbi:MAG: tetratricopeptide repeat protein [Candidatus Lokiarchaeota archaeon]|nr:tetratricopeptide repeat protein [Candidatus Lokiarchaeota archaeon]